MHLSVQQIMKERWKRMVTVLVST